MTVSEMGGNLNTMSSDLYVSKQAFKNAHFSIVHTVSVNHFVYLMFLLFSSTLVNPDQTVCWHFQSYSLLVNILCNGMALKWHKIMSMNLSVPNNTVMIQCFCISSLTVLVQVCIQFAVYMPHTVRMCVTHVILRLLYCMFCLRPRSDQSAECEGKWREISNNTGKNHIGQPTSFIDHSLKVTTVNIITI